DDLFKSKAEIADVTRTISRFNSEIENLKAQRGNLEAQIAEAEEHGELAVKDAKARIADLEAALQKAKQDMARQLKHESRHPHGHSSLYKRPFLMASAGQFLHKDLRIGIYFWAPRVPASSRSLQPLQTTFSNGHGWAIPSQGPPDKFSNGRAYLLN
ncbi:UNVERIFIED_CONTAM: hypothetical protein FKN15_009231, partial [Acipenser sinensis]